MTDELGREIRERLGRAELPGAPDRLRRRLESVATTTPAARSGWPRSRRLGLLVPLAAVLVVAASLALWSAGGRSRASEWGPLAVAEAENGDHARTEGQLVVTEHCVYIERDGERAIVVWPADRTDWDNEQDAITFRRLSGENLTLTSGRDIAVAGGGSSRLEDGLSDEAWVTRQNWVSSPAPECITDERWYLNDVTATSAEGPTRTVLTVSARMEARCASIGGCAYSLELTGDAATWTAGFTRGSPGEDLDIEPGLPATLPPGSYSATAWILTVSDAILNGAQPSFGAESCTARFEVHSGDRRVRLGVAFLSGSCSIAVSR